MAWMPPSSSQDAPFFSVAQARWVVCVVNMVIAVVGKESLLGLILRQTRSEIKSLIRDEEQDGAAAWRACYESN